MVLDVTELYPADDDDDDRPTTEQLWDSVGIGRPPVVKKRTKPWWLTISVYGPLP